MASVARILKRGTWNLKSGVRYSKLGILWPFVDRSIRREFFEAEIDDVFAAKGGGFLPGYSLSLSRSLSACALCHAWVVYAWFIVVSYGKNIRGRSSSKESDEFGSPFERYGSHEIDFYIYTFFFSLFFPFIGNLGGNEYRDTILSVITAIWIWLCAGKEYHI